MNKQVVKQGWLLKKGGRRKNWKKRFFVLLDSPKELRYYESDSASKAKGILNLNEITAIKNSTDPRAPNFSFDITTPKRVFVFSAASQEELEEWMNLIKEKVAS
eukprot:TRINITY_DN7922_c0_g1_i1.p1 TRINITY_DN7922_c0_g1~~TRINITY_DN7922_c0_g1_i1.p1  ORF type:complete len:104 (-),score=23.18 TRINITY_DN7922_c0_g1_i1:86-397(-)